MGSIKTKVQDTLYGNYLTAAVRVVMGALFIYSSLFKLMDPVSFSRVIANYGVLPAALLPYGALFVPGLEMVLGLALLAGFRIRTSSFLSLLLMGAFIAVISLNVARGNSFDCGCFELERFGLSETIGPGIIARDTTLAALLLLVFRARRHVFSLDRALEKRELENL
ncbi:MAG TPA: DoxX family membrane protein [Spirochaetes bacterium]|nr:DoxX family membrane protein [Spirochaetota bacterium]